MSLGWLLYFKEIRLAPEKNIYDSIKNAHQKKYPLAAWQLEGDVLLKAELTILSYKVDRNEIILQTSEGMENHLIQMITGLGKLNFYLNEFSLLFTSDIKKLEPGGKLTISFPQHYFFHDRREGERFEILGLPFAVKLKIGNRQLKKSCFDISKGGLSILFSQSERVPYQTGDLIKDLTLVFGGHEVNFEARVVRILKLKPYMLESIPYGGSRLSLKFEKMAEMDTGKLQKLTAHLEELLKKNDPSS